MKLRVDVTLITQHELLTPSAHASQQPAPFLLRNLPVSVKSTLFNELLLGLHLFLQVLLTQDVKVNLRFFHDQHKVFTLFDCRTLGAAFCEELFRFLSEVAGAVKGETNNIKMKKVQSWFEHIVAKQRVKKLEQDNFIDLDKAEARQNLVFLVFHKGNIQNVDQQLDLVVKGLLDGKGKVGEYLEKSDVQWKIVGIGTDGKGKQVHEKVKTFFFGEERLQESLYRAFLGDSVPLRMIKVKAGGQSLIRDLKDVEFMKVGEQKEELVLSVDNDMLKSIQGGEVDSFYAEEAGAIVPLFSDKEYGRSIKSVIPELDLSKQQMAFLRDTAGQVFLIQKLGFQYKFFGKVVLGNEGEQKQWTEYYLRDLTVKEAGKKKGLKNVEEVKEKLWQRLNAEFQRLKATPVLTFFKPDDKSYLFKQGSEYSKEDQIHISQRLKGVFEITAAHQQIPHALELQKQVQVFVLDMLGELKEAFGKESFVTKLVKELKKMKGCEKWVLNGMEILNNQRNFVKELKTGVGLGKRKRRRRDSEEELKEKLEEEKELKDRLKNSILGHFLRKRRKAIEEYKEGLQFRSIFEDVDDICSNQFQI